MKENLKDEIIELYETLVDNGVAFYYGSESISTGEVTRFDILEDNIIEIELDDYETYEINIDDFIEYHSKEGANYHTWPDIRKFDNKLYEMHSA
ncbi:hypothetical protein R0131_16095 [Clostridium sp. AL.422]|uniref:hypothetical protein n=1 Tax=Clostridium TaxID=1485 RepID=UPI00293DF47A|nr:MULTISPECIES: hypothetical protein [unclassified Clostridium]MDV4152348.1 hypothetical protein [Clostridium sp. AL.422]